MIKNIIASIIVSGLVSLTILGLVIGKTDTVQGVKDLGGSIETVLNRLGAGVQIGSDGSVISKVATGFMNCTGASTIAASAISNYDCSVLGVRSGDKVFTQSASGTPNFIGHFTAYASTTVSGSVRLVLRNSSTTASVAPTGATTSIPYYIVR